MRIAMLGDFPLDLQRIPGGVEAVIMNLCVAMAPLNDVDLHLLVSCEEVAKTFSKNHAGFTIHYLPSQRKLGNITGYISDRKRLVAAIRELNPDIVHAHGTGKYAAAAQKSGFPYVTTPHGMRFKEVMLYGGLTGWVRRITVTRMEKTVLYRSTHLFVIAEYVRKTIAPYTSPSAKFYSIANPVAERYFGMETSDPGDTILSVATVQPRKGIIYLVEAVGEVRKQVPDVRLRLIGKVLDPEYDEAVRAKIKELKLEDVVEMVGFVTDDELKDAFTTCSLFTLCSMEESSPVSIAEAMTLGKPVVASAVGGVPDLVADGQTGFLIQFGDVPGIASALTKVLTDRDLRTRFGEAARQRAYQDFHPTATAKSSVEVYKIILSETGGKQ